MAAAGPQRRRHRGAGGQAASSSLFGQVMRREWTGSPHGWARRFTTDSLLPNVCSTDDATFRFSNSAGDTVPPFTASFSTEACRGHLLAVGDEEGYISLLDTSVPAESDQYGNLVSRPGGHASPSAASPHACRPACSPNVATPTCLHACRVTRRLTASSLPRHTFWQAHKNAVFAVEWAENDRR